MPSNQHELLKARAMAWLSSRATPKGMRAGTEVHVSDGYKADVVAFADVTGKFDKKLLELSYGSYPDPPMQPLGPYAWIFECKISRSDFLSTFGYDATGRNERDPSPALNPKGRARVRGNVHLCVTTGDFEVEELPDWWGHLALYGSGLTIKSMPRYCSAPPIGIVRLHERVLWTCEAKTMFTLLKKVRKEHARF